MNNNLFIEMKVLKKFIKDNKDAEGFLISPLFIEEFINKSAHEISDNSKYTMDPGGLLIPKPKPPKLPDYYEDMEKRKTLKNEFILKQ